MSENAAPPQIALAYAGTDRQRAEALARILKALGYEVATQPKTTSVVDESVALVALWSQASINSGPIITLASHAAIARKLICVRAGVADPPAAFSLVTLHDLSGWTGSSEAPQLRALLQHLASLAPPPRAPQAAPVSSPFFVSRIAEPKVAPAPVVVAAPPKPAQPPSAEAIAWAQIHRSENPADFREHLEIFGQSGAYAPLARERLRDLESRPAPAPVAPAEAAAPRRKTAAPPARKPKLGRSLARAALVASGIAASAAFVMTVGPRVMPLLDGRTAPVLPAPAEMVTAPAPTKAVHAGPAVAAPETVEAAAPAPEIAPAPVTEVAAASPPPVQAAPVPTPAPAASQPVRAAAVELQPSTRLIPTPPIGATARNVSLGGSRPSSASSSARPQPLPPNARPLPPETTTPVVALAAAPAPSAAAASPPANPMAGAADVDFAETAPEPAAPAESPAEPDRAFKRMEYKAAPE